ncbi:MAG: acetylornithine/N-succinyldiaminopimelate aminotransferase [Verrucomicrobiales bacterium]|jgi:acetylornithine/N-succinyldiaminopimelate aminotransferase
MSVNPETSTQQLLERYVTPNYGRFQIAFARGKGSRIWDENGREYLDFGTGIATCPLGHCHGAITAAVHAQVEALIHCSNLYLIREQARLAQNLVENVVEEPGKVFFCNSGAEANETLIKLARKFGREAPLPGGQPRGEIITFDSCFHGRTMAGISATAQDKVKAGFAPLLEGFVHTPYNDLDTLRAAITHETVAILLEPIQGEGGIVPATPEFLRGVAEICRERNLLFMLDEVQCGIGRTGALCGWKSILDDADVFPDAVSWAKGIGGGLPIGAVWIRNRPISAEARNEPLCDVLGPGTHGSTFGGNPLVAATSLAVLEEIQQNRLWENATAMGQLLRETIEGWNDPHIEGVRGLGLMLGIVLNEEAFDTEGSATPSVFMVKKLMDAGLLTIPAGTRVVRLLPALNVEKSEVTEALKILKSELESLK